MAQANIILANTTRTIYRARHNDINQALATFFSGPTAPANPIAHQPWLDTSQNPPLLRRRNSANSAWDVATPLPPTLSEGDVRNAGSTTPGLMTGQRLSQAVEQFSPPSVRLGGGAGMFGNAIRLGWNGSNILAQVDSTPQGAILTTSIPTGGFGKYAILRDYGIPNGQTIVAGSIRSGSSLGYVDLNGNGPASGGSAPGGSWRLHGTVRESDSGSAETSLWERVQ